MWPSAGFARNAMANASFATRTCDPAHSCGYATSATTDPIKEDASSVEVQVSPLIKTYADHLTINARIQYTFFSHLSYMGIISNCIKFDFHEVSHSNTFI